MRYDLRDAGQSTFVDPDAPPYDLRDLVTDASELLVALDLGRTHGVALAAEIPGTTLLTLTGIGQGVPRVTWPDVVEALLCHTS